jgi:hypothetical protein
MKRLKSDENVKNNGNSYDIQSVFDSINKKVTDLTSNIFEEWTL